MAYMDEHMWFLKYAMILPSDCRGEVSSPKMFLSCEDTISASVLINTVVFGRGDPAPMEIIFQKIELTGEPFSKLTGKIFYLIFFKNFTLLLFLFQERYALDHPVGGRFALEVMVKELMYTASVIFLVFISAQAVPFPWIR